MLKENSQHIKLEQLGEKEILNRLKKYMDFGQIDDDTALITSSQKDLIINTDMLVEDVHFSEATSIPIHIGWKAIAVNISDLAASGVEEILGVTVGLIAPASTNWSWVDGVYTGIQDALNTFGGKLLGGDCSRGNQKSLSITVVGTKGPLNLHRSNAKPGDHLVTSGPHGLSRLGLGLLLSDPFLKSLELPQSLKEQAIKAHQTPIPALNALEKLIFCKPSSSPWRAAATDSSDGLLEAIECLCKSSKCTAIIEPQNLPIHHEWPKGPEWDSWCLEGGEDYELVVSLPPIWAKAWRKTLPLSKTIGKMKKGSPKVIWSNGETIRKSSTQTYKHF